MRRHNKKGGVLIYVLGIIAVLSIVVTEFLSGVTGEVQYRAQVMGKEDLREVAWNALSSSIAVLDEVRKVDKGIYSYLQAWNDPLKYSDFQAPEGYEVKIKLKDETAKVSIYDENPDLINAVLEGIGVGFVEKQNMLSQLPDFLKKTKKVAFPGATKTIPKPEPENNEENEKKEPDNKKPGKNKPKKNKTKRIIYDFDELKELNAFKTTFWNEEGETELFRKFKEVFTIYNKGGKVNVNTASPIIQSILVGSADITTERYYKNKNELSAAFGSKLRSEWIGFEVKVLGIRAEVLRGPVKFTMTILLELGNTPQKNRIILLEEDHNVIN